MTNENKNTDPEEAEENIMEEVSTESEESKTKSGESETNEAPVSESAQESEEHSEAVTAEEEDDENFKWYAVRIISGHENKVKAFLDNEIRNEKLEHKIKNVLIPLEKIYEVKGGKIAFKVDKAGIIHASIGRISFTPEKIAENSQELLNAIIRAKPSSAKGTYLRGISMASTMSPGINIDSKAFAH